MKVDEEVVRRIVQDVPLGISVPTEEDQREAARQLHAKDVAPWQIALRVRADEGTVRRWLNLNTPSKRKRRSATLTVNNRDDAMRLINAITHVGGGDPVTEAHPDYEAIIADALAIIEHLRDSDARLRDHRITT